MGAPIRILNNYSKRTIDAIATGAGEARVPS
jgi:flagella basal body P-ring formation protein FlgA